MTNINGFLIFLITVASINANANDAALKSLFDSQEVLSSQSIGPKTSGDMQASTSMIKRQSCDGKSQNSLPLKLVMGLLRDQGASLVPSHNSDTGELTVYGGRMIGNCSSMLDYVLSPPSEKLPYVFQVKIRGCGADKCTYKARTMVDGASKFVEPSPSFEPTMQGFIKCLQTTGVMNEDYSINKDKIVNEEFKATQPGVDTTSSLVFASHGPYTSQVYGKGGSLHDTGDCYFFENIQKDGFQIYSEADVKYNRAKDEFKSICKSGSYKLIDGRISDFDQFSSLQDTLIASRDKLLVGEYKQLHELLKNDDYSEVDSEEIHDTTKDFYEYIVLPLKNAIKEKYVEMVNSRGKAKKERQKELDALVAELKEYALNPYPNSADLKNMQNIKRKAPLGDDEWSDSILYLNAIQNTAAVYQQYSGDGKKESTKYADAKINDAQKEFSDDFKILRRIATDKEYSRVAELKRQSQNIQKKTMRSQVEMQQDIQQEYARIQQHCYGKYWVNTQRCVAEAQEEIMAIQEETYMYGRRNNKLMQDLDIEAKRWGSIEGDRYSGTKQGELRNGAYHFNMNNTMTTGNGGPMPSQMQPNFQYPAMWGQQTQQNFGANRNFFPGQYNMGFMGQQAFGMPQRYPANGINQWQYGGFQSSPYNMGFGQGMPPAYSNQMMSGGYQFGV